MVAYINTLSKHMKEFLKWGLPLRKKKRRFLFYGTSFYVFSIIFCLTLADDVLRLYMQEYSEELEYLEADSGDEIEEECDMEDFGCAAVGKAKNKNCMAA